MKSFVKTVVAEAAAGRGQAAARVVASSKQADKQKAMNCFVYINGEYSLEMANKSDARMVASGAADLSLMHGALVSVKDNIATIDEPHRSSSRILEGYKAPYDATATARLKSAGAVLFGRTNMDEFGMGSSTANTPYGPAIHPSSPWLSTGQGPRITCGGSSGGAAASVASGAVAAAIGSDTGGSVRQPASFCGVVGLKPSYGLIPRYGLTSYASSMDTVGVLTTSVLDAAVMLDELSGVDIRDPTCIKDAEALRNRDAKSNQISGVRGNGTSGVGFRVGKYTRSLLRTHDAGFKDPTAPLSPKDMTDLINKYEDSASKSSLGGVVVGVPEQFSLDGIDDAILRAWNESIQKLADAGATIRQVSVPSITKALPTYYVLVCAEASSNLSRYDGVRYGYRTPSAKVMNITHGDETTQKNGNDVAKDFFTEISRTRGEGFGHEVVKRILTGTYVLSQSSYHEYYMEAVAWRKRIIEESRHALRSSAAGGVDVLIGPTAPILPFDLDNRPSAAQMLLCDIYTVGANLAGLPAVSLPVDKAGPLNLPIGMQLTGRYRGESDLLRIARALEQRSSFKI